MSAHVLPVSGRIWSWTLQAFPPKPPYRSPVGGHQPYHLGYVDLGEVLVEARLAVPREEIRIGLPVRLTFLDGLFGKGDVPRVEPEPLLPGDHVPGGLVALTDGRGGIERPIWAPEQRAIIFADGMTAPKDGGGLLRIWWTPVIDSMTKPALRAMLDLPFEWVLVSHGEPVHTREDFIAALDREPWSVVDWPASRGGDDSG